MLIGLKWESAEAVVVEVVVEADVQIALVIDVECLNPVVDARNREDVLSAKGRHFVSPDPLTGC
jgi:hypothetical protein